MKKKCAICGDSKELEDFYKVKRSIDGKSNVCKPCHRERSKERVKRKAETRDGFFNTFL